MREKTTSSPAHFHANGRPMRVSVTSKYNRFCGSARVEKSSKPRNVKKVSPQKKVKFWKPETDFDDHSTSESTISICLCKECDSCVLEARMLEEFPFDCVSSADVTPENYKPSPTNARAVRQWMSAVAATANARE